MTRHNVLNALAWLVIFAVIAFGVVGMVVDLEERGVLLDFAVGFVIGVIVIVAIVRIILVYIEGDNGRRS
jgi:hypothetical protein